MTEYEKRVSEGTLEEMSMIDAMLIHLCIEALLVGERDPLIIKDLKELWIEVEYLYQGTEQLEELKKIIHED